jgi:hypothetical protein
MGDNTNKLSQAAVDAIEKEASKSSLAAAKYKTAEADFFGGTLGEWTLNFDGPDGEPVFASDGTPDETVASYLQVLKKKHGFKEDSEVYGNIMRRQTFNKCINGHVNKNTILLLCVLLHADFEETEHMLGVAGYHFSGEPLDTIVRTFMRPEHKKDYSYENIQLVIDDMEEKRAAGKLKYGNRKYVNPPIKWPTLVIK